MLVSELELRIVLWFKYPSIDMWELGLGLVLGLMIVLGYRYLSIEVQVLGLEL